MCVCACHIHMHTLPRLCYSRNYIFIYNLLSFQLDFTGSDRVEARGEF